METAEKVGNSLPCLRLLTTEYLIGGKAKPLKAPKKQKQDLDEDDVAFREKQKAGMAMWLCHSYLATDRTLIRCQSEQGDGRESKGKGPYECGTTRNQEIREEVGKRLVGSVAIALQGVGGCE